MTPCQSRGLDVGDIVLYRRAGITSICMILRDDNDPYPLIKYLQSSGRFSKNYTTFGVVERMTKIKNWNNIIM